MIPALRTLPSPGTPRTLSIDIGGSGVKSLVLDSTGEPVTERVRMETPRPATPRRILETLCILVEGLGPFERVSVGFPGVVVDGVTHTAPNLHPDWAGFPLARTIQTHFERPTRVINDAGLQGYGVVEGRGVEILLTLGTALGFALFNEGVYVPNIELGELPFRKRKTVQDYVGDGALEAVGKKRWNRRVARVVNQLLPIFNPRLLYLGGGNAKLLNVELPPQVRAVTNRIGLRGGIALWRGSDSA